MLLFIMFVVVLLIGIGLLILKEKVFDWDSIFYSTSFVVGAVFCIIAGLGLVICSTIAISENLPIVRQQVINGLNQKVEEIQSDYNYIQTITDDRAKSIAVVEYNKKVREFKTKVLTEQYVLNNIWINWYTSPEYGNYDVDIVVYIK